MDKLRGWLDSLTSGFGGWARRVIKFLLFVLAVAVLATVLKHTLFASSAPKPTLKIDTWACPSAGDANGLVEVRGSGFTPGGQVRISEMTFSKFRLGVERIADLHGKTIWLFKCDVAGEIAFNAVDKSTSRVAIKVVTIKK